MAILRSAQQGQRTRSAVRRGQIILVIPLAMARARHLPNVNDCFVHGIRVAAPVLTRLIGCVTNMLLALVRWH